MKHMFAHSHLGPFQAEVHVEEFLPGMFWKVPFLALGTERIKKSHRLLGPFVGSPHV